MPLLTIPKKRVTIAELQGILVFFPSWIPIIRSFGIIPYRSYYLTKNLVFFGTRNCLTFSEWLPSFNWLCSNETSTQAAWEKWHHFWLIIKPFFLNHNHGILPTLPIKTALNVDAPFPWVQWATATALTYMLRFFCQGTQFWAHKPAASRKTGWLLIRCFGTF